MAVVMVVVVELGIVDLCSATNSPVPEMRELTRENHGFPMCRNKKGLVMNGESSYSSAAHRVESAYADWSRKGLHHWIGVRN